jgi:hypothetical protein
MEWIYGDVGSCLFFSRSGVFRQISARPGRRGLVSRTTPMPAATTFLEASEPTEQHPGPTSTLAGGSSQVRSSGVVALGSVSLQSAGTAKDPAGRPQAGKNRPGV